MKITHTGPTVAVLSLLGSSTVAAPILARRVLNAQFFGRTLKMGTLAFLVGLSVWGFAFAFSVHQGYGGRVNDPRAYAFIPLCLIFMGPLVVTGMLFCHQYRPLLNAAAQVAGLSLWVVLMWVPRSLELVSLIGSDAHFHRTALEIEFGPAFQRIIDVCVGFILPFWASALSYRRVFKPAAHRLSCVLLRFRTGYLVDLKSPDSKERFSDFISEHPFVVRTHHFKGEI